MANIMNIKTKENRTKANIKKEITSMKSEVIINYYCYLLFLFGGVLSSHPGT